MTHSGAPLLSVVVPLFNKAPYVRRALESVARQSFERIEILVVDDGSTDGGAEVVRGFEDPRVRMVRQENQGEGAARNRGVAETSGELVAMIDADDEWDPEFLETVAGLWHRFPEAGLLGTGYRSQYRSGLVLETSIPGRDEGCLVEDYFSVASRASIVWSSAQALPRLTFERVGPFSGDSLGADLDMWGRVALRYPVAYSSRILATYHKDVAGVVSYYRGPPIYPRFVRSARRELEAGAVPTEMVNTLNGYLNHLLMQYVRRLTAGRDRVELKRVLREDFTRQEGWRGTVAGLQLAAAVAPLPLLDLLLRARLSRWGWMGGVSGTGGLVRRAEQRVPR